MPSRCSKSSKILRTEVVPAPEEPVTAMMGCRLDMGREHGNPSPAARKPGYSRGDAHRAELELRAQRIGERACLAAIGQATDVDPIGRLPLRG